MLAFSESATINGELSSIWQTAIDAASWSAWDPHLVDSGFEGPFAPGSSGWTILPNTPKSTKGPFTVTKVEHERSYATESAMPFGKMCITATFEPVGAGQVRVGKSVQVHGPFGPVFRLFWLKSMRRDMHHTFAALAQEAQRRAAEAGSNR
ncbi:SRPBCC family protein [Streptosporangium sp. NBC_01639]|uniref:SRPBCC family protein n=1 Tax=unclassified Streptosporangium TaxID=2632669 RepID=UPI002DD7A1E9|nr:SRPBCC family protein [Streptosporangium sp. NBC_01756]WSC88666.1 SRPBCC family protein [Streptosporangium sp. NBC_01756]WTD52642.1 SRPBCC family protein [Streptosporangium sp. NBC_01639]